MRDYPRIFAICKKHKLDYKEQVHQFTEGRTESLRSLSDAEFREFLSSLIRASNGTGYTPKPGDKQRKKLISICRSMNWGISNAIILQKLNDWCLKQKFKKPLMEHTETELNLLVAIMEQRVYPDYLKDLNR